MKVSVNPKSKLTYLQFKAQVGKAYPSEEAVKEAYLSFFPKGKINEKSSKRSKKDKPDRDSREIDSQ